jgi:thiaminase (transcriptional activator TenA)
MAPSYEAILKHPFLTGLSDGSLEPEAFAHYVTQDVHYLRDYARCLAVVGAKAPASADTAMFSRHSAGALQVELGLHDALLSGLHLDAAALAASEAGPTTRAYTSYLLATAYGGSFAEGLAAVLPCYWIYAEVGKVLQQHGSPNPQYQQWIDTYAGEEFAVLVKEVLDLVDRAGAELAAAERERAHQHLIMTARYEWMFWDASYRLEEWAL